MKSVESGARGGVRVLKGRSWMGDVMRELGEDGGLVEVVAGRDGGAGTRGGCGVAVRAALKREGGLAGVEGAEEEGGSKEEVERSTTLSEVVAMSGLIFGVALGGASSAMSSSGAKATDFLGFVFGFEVLLELSFMELFAASALAKAAFLAASFAGSRSSRFRISGGKLSRYSCACEPLGISIWSRSSFGRSGVGPTFSSFTPSCSCNLSIWRLYFSE